jgi:hypothetical protein
LVQDTFSLSRAGHDLLDEFTSLPPEAQAAFLEDLANLLRAGVVGTETLDYRGEAYTSFLSTRPADPAVAHARTLPRHS